MNARRTLLKRAGLAVAACGLATVAGPVRAAPIKLRFANNLPLSFHLTAFVKQAFDKIRKDSNGEVDIELFPAGQLGSDQDMFSQLRSGAIDFHSNSSTGVMSTVVPQGAIGGIGYAFKSAEQVWAAMDGELGAHIRGHLAKAGVYVFPRILDIGGFRQITSSTRPIRTADDLRGMKIRVPPAQLYVSLFRALGAAPTGMSFGEVYTSLQTKLIDGQENPLGIVETARLYEVQKYVSVTNHMWDGQWFVANMATWMRLPEDVRRLIESNVNAAALAQRAEVVRQNVALEGLLKSKGMEFVQSDVESFRAALNRAKYYAEWKQRFGADTWALLEKAAGTALG